MGWPKYLEDIQKLREHALSLAEVKISQVAYTSPELAIRELENKRSQIENWAMTLVSTFTDILDQATNPSIQEAFEKKELIETVNRLSFELDERLSERSIKDKRREDVIAMLLFQRENLLKEVQGERQSKKELQQELVRLQVMRDDEICRLKTELDEQFRELQVAREKVGLLEMSVKEGQVFSELMKGMGVSRGRKA